MPLRRDRRVLLATALAAAVQRVAAAEAGPMRIVVGFAPGGASDAVARAFARALEPLLARPVLVEPRPGADGAIAAQAVAAAPPDGATLLLGSSTALVAVPSLRTPPPYDPFAAFTPVCGLGRFSMALLVHASMPVRSVAELLRLVEHRPEAFSAAASNSTAELALTQLMGWRRVVVVSYRGDAPALLDLVAGRVQMMFATGAAADAYLAQGRLRRLATTEPGGIELDVTPWLGLFGPAGLALPTRAALARALAATLSDAPLQQHLRTQRFLAEVLPPEAFDRYFRLQYARFAASARRAGLRLER